MVLCADRWYYLAFSVGTGGKEDSGFDGHREDDFFDQPGFGSARGGDGGAFDKLAEARFADAEESWESRARVESTAEDDGMHCASKHAGNGFGVALANHVRASVCLHVATC